MKHLSTWFSDFWLQLAAVFESGIRLYCKGGAAKVFLVITSSAIAVPFDELFQRYIFSDWTFLAFVLVLLTFDLISGVYKASGWWDSSRKTPNSLNRRVFIIKLTEKVFASTVWLIVMNFVKVYASTQSEFAATYSNYFGNCVLGTWLIWSIFANLFVITKGQFPPIGLLKRLAAVNKSGNLADLDKEPVEEIKTPAP